MSKLKKMNLNNLKSQTNKEFTQRTVIIDQYEFLIDDKFKPSKMQLLLAEFQDKIEYANENEININPLLIIYTLLIKHFTSISIPDELEKQLDMLNILIDLGYFEKILNEFNPKEVERIIQSLTRGIDNMKAVIEKLESPISELIENADI